MTTNTPGTGEPIKGENCQWITHQMMCLLSLMVSTSIMIKRQLRFRSSFWFWLQSTELGNYLHFVQTLSSQPTVTFCIEFPPWGSMKYNLIEHTVAAVTLRIGSIFSDCPIITDQPSLCLRDAAALHNAHIQAQK